MWGDGAVAENVVMARSQKWWLFKNNNNNNNNNDDDDDDKPDFSAYFKMLIWANLVFPSQTSLAQ